MKFIEQYGLWAVTHALYKYPHSFAVYKDLFVACPALWLAVAFARGIPRVWLALGAIFGLQWLLVPVNHYILPLLPFLCLMAAIAWRCSTGDLRNWVLIFSLFTFVRVAKDAVMPWRDIIGKRAYGMADNYEMARKLREVGVLPPPIWSGWPALYFLMGWTVPVTDFINAGQIDEGKDIDWSTPPYSTANTRIELIPTMDHPSSRYHDKIEGWYSVDINLKRGQFKTMRIWRRA